MEYCLLDILHGITDDVTGDLIFIMQKKSASNINAGKSLFFLHRHWHNYVTKIKISLVETFQNIKQQFEIDVDVTPTALIRKNIWLLVFQFFEKVFFSNLLETLRVSDNFKHVGKLFQTVGVKQDNVFWSEHVLLDGCFSFKTEDFVFIWSCPGVYINHVNVEDNSH